MRVYAHNEAGAVAMPVMFQHTGVRRMVFACLRRLESVL